MNPIFSFKNVLTCFLIIGTIVTFDSHPTNALYAIVIIATIHGKDFWNPLRAKTYSKPYLVIHCSDLEALEKLLQEEELDVNSKIEDDWTLLMHAVASQKIDMAKFLIDKGADVNISKDNQYCPILLACTSLDVEMVKLLLDNNVNVNEQGFVGSYPLSSIYLDMNDFKKTVEEKQNDRIAIAKLLIDAGTDLSMKTITGDSALHYACFNNNIDIMKILLEAGADVNAKQNDEQTPLIVAVKNDFLEIVKLLIDFKADVNIKAQGGWSALHIACLVKDVKNNVEITKLLLENKADVDNKDNEAEVTPLYCACLNNYTEIVKLLLEYDADINIKVKNGEVALDIATENKNLEIVQLLKEKIDKKAENKNT